MTLSFWNIPVIGWWKYEFKLIHPKRIFSRGAQYEYPKSLCKVVRDDFHLIPSGSPIKNMTSRRGNHFHGAPASPSNIGRLKTSHRNYHQQYQLLPSDLFLGKVQVYKFFEGFSDPPIYRMKGVTWKKVVAEDPFLSLLSLSISL